MPAQKRALSGGCRQRAWKAGHLAEESGQGSRLLGKIKRASSVLAVSLIRAFVWGDKTGIDVKRTASWAVADGLDHPEVILLSKLGDDHAHGELMDLLAPSPYASCCLNFDVCFKRTNKLDVQTHSQTMMLPHRLFSQMYHHQHDQFIERFCGGSTSRIPEFWDAMADSPQFETNDDLKARHNFRRKCIPLSMHGDGLSIVGVKKTWQKCADVFSYSPLLGKGCAFKLMYIKRDPAIERKREG